MSGLFLTCWDFNKDVPGTILKPTKGGWPHITLVYTGKTLNVDTLKVFAGEAFNKWVDTSFTLTHAYVNSFQLDSGEWRHDCLLAVDPATTVEIQQYRQESIVARFSRETSSKFSMNDPHVTAGIFNTREAAQALVNSYKTLLPRVIGITGVTI